MTQLQRPASDARPMERAIASVLPSKALSHLSILLDMVAGAAASSTHPISRAITPRAVLAPVLMTTALALPDMTRQPMKTMFLHSHTPTVS
eukprot:CAMPEP_0196745170 /NCGR_PEP_ID=MMETSP1091-20130531/60438_1 /TAXON_ID=302021 /ORGANISM="Rhodomonas sp., Strain CCMP768" /LENGTH=90 /DNA_ID=CAMNT_0042091883 /DNA_START=23 /DNA_END=291 /DNA_ORIENTATION=-